MNERERRWRLVLGESSPDGMEAGFGQLSQSDSRMDDTLSALYDSERKGGLGDTSPDIARWLGDIRAYFPASVVRLLQQDALERLNLRQLLFEPELLAAVEPDVQLVANLVALSQVMPGKTKETARMVVEQVVAELKQKFTPRMEQSVRGAMQRAARKRRPRHQEINWARTVQKNLKHYQPDYRTIVPEQLVGYGRKSSRLKDLIIALDQSGSMGTSIVYGSIFAAVMASMPALQSSLITFSSSVADLTPELHDPVSLLFGTRLGGGTDINQALAYCQRLVQRPRETILLLITDLYEGGDPAQLMQRIRELHGSGVTVIVLLALNDQGRPSYDQRLASRMGELGIPVFACTPDLFPDLMGAAIQGQDLQAWAGRQDVQLAGGETAVNPDD